MNESLEAIRKLIDECSPDEQKAIKSHLSVVAPHPLEGEWGVDADTILNAIQGSSDLTKRGVRGIIAEAVFETSVLPALVGSGWSPVKLQGDWSYDVLLEKEGRTASIQIKLQRLEKGVPKLYYPRHYIGASLYVVEVQKTRGGEKRIKRELTGSEVVVETTTKTMEETRPYRFGDFDILAVNMHPSSGDWKSFRYTLGRWLIPRGNDERKIEIFQPVSATANDVWTDDLSTCLRWFESGDQRSVLPEILHPQRRK